MSENLTDQQLEELAKIVGKATSGKWEIESQKFGTDWGDVDVFGIKNVSDIYETGDSDMANVYCGTLDEEDAKHIAAFNPLTAAALVAEVQELRATVERVRHTVEVEKHWTTDCGWDVPAGRVIASLALDGQEGDK